MSRGKLTEALRGMHHTTRNLDSVVAVDLVLLSFQFLCAAVQLLVGLTGGCKSLTEVNTHIQLKESVSLEAPGVQKVPEDKTTIWFLVGSVF